jgi:hypothetical protein
MAFSEIELALIDETMTRFIEGCRPPVAVRAQLDFGFRIEGQSVILFEIRPDWRNPGEKHEHPVAKATFVTSRGRWKLYWQRADLKWHLYEPEPLCDQLTDVLDVVKADAFGCFWG